MAKIVTITNPLTGQPTQVDQLEHTAQQIDNAITRALPGGAIDIALQNKLGGIESTDYPGCYYRMVSGVVEWFNPPMELGKEYRTVERYRSKPVYCMTKFVGEVTANTVTQVVIDASDIGEYCIRAFCTGKRTFGNWEDDTTTMVSSPAGSEAIITCDPTIYRLNKGYRSIRAYIKSNVNLKDVYCTAYYTKWAD